MFSPTHLSIRNMEYIAAIAEYQNITKAAESLFISQPALSRYLQTLENEIGAKLFNRQNGRYCLTFVGERYLYYANQINSLNKQLESELNNIIANEHGRLRLSLPSHRSPTFIPEVLPKFYEKHPYVEIILNEVTSAEQEGLLLNGKVDLAITIDPLDNPSIESIPIKKDYFLLAVPEEHPLYKRGGKHPNKKCPLIDLKDISDDYFILPPKGQHTRTVADSIFAEMKINPKIKLNTRNIETMLHLVSNNLGICIISSTYANHIKIKKPVSFFYVDSKYANTSIDVAYIKNSYQPPYFRDFIDIVKEMM